MGGIVFRELTGVRAASDHETSFVASLATHLCTKAGALASGDGIGAAHAARAAAESYRRLGNCKAAVDELRFAEATFRVAGCEEGLAWTLFSVGNLRRQQSEFDGALSALRRALTLASGVRDEGLAAYVIAGIAETTRILGDYAWAYRQHLAAYDIFRSMRDARGAVWALEGVGQMLRNSGRPIDALRHFTKAKRIAASCGDTRGLAYALKCRAECLALLGHHDSAADEVALAVALFDEIGLRPGLAYTYKAAGNVAAASGRHDTARDAYSRAGTIFASMEDRRGLAYVHLDQGILCLQVEEPESASRFLAESDSVFHARRIRLGAYRSSAALKCARPMLRKHVFGELVGADRAARLGAPLANDGMKLSSALRKLASLALL